MSSRTHVLSVIGYPGLGGDEHRLLTLAQHLDRDRIRLSVLVLESRGTLDDSHGSLLDALLETPAEVHFLDDVRRRGSWLASSETGRVRHLGGRVASVTRLIADWGVDVVDARLELGLIVGVSAARLRRRPSVVTMYNAKPPFPYPGWRVFRQGLLPAATAFVTDSQARLDDFQSRVYRMPRRSAVVPNGVAPPLPRHSREDTLRQLGVGASWDGPIVGQIGGIVPYKGLHTVVEAAALVRERSDLNVLWLLIGFPRSLEYRRRLEAEARERGVADRLVIREYPGAIGDIWQLIDVHVHASMLDSLPNAILEGMSLGKPCVTSGVGGISEAVIDGESGVLVSPGDARGVSEAVLRLLNKPQLRRRLGQNAARRHEAHYGPARLAFDLQKIFTDLGSLQ